MMRMDGSDSLEPSRTPPQLSHTVRWIPWILWSSNTVARGRPSYRQNVQGICEKSQFFNMEIPDE